MTDLSVTPNPLSLLKAQARYGEINNGVWGGESLWCSLLEIPDEISENWINTATGNPTTHIYCNKDFQPHLLAALCNIKNQGLLSELETFNGCFMIRDVRAEPGKASAHSYGLAIDVNASTNQLGHPTTFSPEFLRCWTKAGLIWGGNFRRCDPMHFTMGW